jgi:predicted nuclease of restriction endonuclease-like (RecB) superfamily
MDEPANSKSEESTIRSFVGITFTHHLLLLNKCKSYEERIFYMRLTADSFWSVETLEHHIKENFFGQVGKMDHNFDTTIQAG